MVRRMSTMGGFEDKSIRVFEITLILKKSLLDGCKCKNVAIGHCHAIVKGFFE
jgi:hypothetical protein